MKEWKDISHYGGFDWAKDHHAVVIVDAQGQIAADFEIEHTLEGWKHFNEKTVRWPNLAVAIEANQGAAVPHVLIQCPPRPSPAGRGGIVVRWFDTAKDEGR